MMIFLALLFILLFPYTIVHNADFLIIIAVFVLAMLSTFAFFIISLVSGYNSRKIALSGMLLKLLHIPAYILFFIAGVMGTMLGRFIILTLIVYIIDCALIFMTGMVSLSAVIRAKDENKISKKSAIIMGILSFVFCIDVIVSIVLYVKIRKFDKLHNSCLETDSSNCVES